MRTQSNLPENSILGNRNEVHWPQDHKQHKSSVHSCSSGLYFKHFLCLSVTFVSNDCQWMKIVFLDILFLVNALTSSEELGIPLLMS